MNRKASAVATEEMPKIIYPQIVSSVADWRFIAFIFGRFSFSFHFFFFFVPSSLIPLNVGTDSIGAVSILFREWPNNGKQSSTKPENETQWK